MKSTTIRELVARPSRRTLVLIALVVVTGAGIGAWRLQTGSASAAQTAPSVKANVGDVVVSVGGVGRIVEASSTPITVPTSTGAGSAGTGSGGSVSAPAGAVFPSTSGHVARFLVTAGQRVKAGDAIAVLDDGGAAATSIDLARVELQASEYELQQKRTSDPQRGLPPTRAELEAARAAVVAAKARLARLRARPRAADVSAARLDVKRAEAELQTLRGGSPEARKRAIAIATQTVEAAEARLARLLGPPDPADVSAARADLAKAEADLATLQRPNITPAPEALAAALKLVNDARGSLALAQRSGDAETIRDAQAALDEALAELAALLKPGPDALPAQIDAAQKAVDAAGLRLARVLGPPNPADVASARLDVERARAELRSLSSGPSSAALAAAREAVTAGEAKLAQVLGPPPRSDLTAARLDVRKAEADLTVLQTRGTPASPFDISLAELKVRAARDRLDLARRAAAALSVRAPSAGTVTALLTVPGAPVDASTAIATVNDLDSLGVSVDMSEFDAARVKPGQKAIVRVDALGGKALVGKVRFTALTGTDNAGVVTFPVRVSLRRAAGLKPGMNVSVRVIVAERHDVVLIPLEAVSRDDEDRAVVTVLDTGEEVERRVQLGLANNKSVEIVKGLRAGERVVLPEADNAGEET